MDKKTIFVKTEKGERETANLPNDLRRILSLIDNKSKSDELSKRAPPSLRESWYEILGELVAGGYIVDKNKPAEPKIATPKIAVPKFNPMKIFSPKAPVAPEEPTDDLDFSTPSAVDLAARQKAEEAARARAELEAAMEAAKVKAAAEAAAKAEAKARQDAEMEARARAIAEAKAKQEAMVREQVEAKAKQEAAARMHAEQEAARAKAVLEAAARAKAEAQAKVRADIEAAARAQQEAEQKAKREAEAAAKLKAEQESVRVKAEMEAIAKAKAEAEEVLRKAQEEAARVKAEAARIKAEQEAAAERARQEAEAARIKAEQEAARIRAEAEERARQEAEAARIRAEQEAARIRAEAEERARKEAEAARLKAEQEAAERARQEAEAARIKAEQEAARLRAEAEERARQEAETARLKAEQEVARIRAEQAEEARVRAEAEARAAAEAAARAKLEAEQVVNREAAELARISAEQSVADVIVEKVEPAAPGPAFEIDLAGFLGKHEQAQQPVAVARQAEERARAEAAAQAEAEAAARQEAEQRAAAAAKAEAEKRSTKDMAAEMARLKEEAEAARRKAEEEATRKAEEQALAEEQSKAWAEAEQRAKAQALQEAELAAQQAVLAQAKASQKTVSKVRRKPLPLGKIAAGLVALALLAVVVLPYVYPLKDYIAPLEQKLSAQLKQPVRISSMSAASLPPTLKLQGVTLGKAQEVKIGSVVLSLDLFSLLSDVKVVSNAALQDVSIDGGMIGKQSADLLQLGRGAGYELRHMDLQKVKFVTDEIELPSFNGIAELDAHGAFSRVSLHTQDDKLGFELQPNQGRWRLGVSVKERSLPILPDIVFSDLNAKGDLNEGDVNFTEVDGHIFNGILLGGAKLSWRKGWQLQGHYEAKLFELSKMFPKNVVDGEMYGDGTFTLTGTKLSQLKDAPHLEGSFSIKSGTITGFDIVETARLQSRENLVGGRTHYDELIGTVEYDNHTTRFRQVKIASGMLSASGSFEIAPNNQLSGTINAEIKMRAGNNLLTLYGTVTEPKLRAGH